MPFPASDTIDHKARVHIRYQVETGTAKPQYELPFIVGVLADLSGDREQTTDLFDRKLHDVTGGTFDNMLQKINPRLSFEVPDELSGEKDSSLPVDLEFKSLADFTPGKIAERVKPLNDLLEMRKELTALKSFIRANPQTQKTLQQILSKVKPAAKS